MASALTAYATTYGSGLSVSSLVPLWCPGLPRVGGDFEGSDTLINCPHGRFGKVRVVMLEVILDVL